MERGNKIILKCRSGFDCCPRRIKRPFQESHDPERPIHCRCSGYQPENPAVQNARARPNRLKFSMAPDSSPYITLVPDWGHLCASVGAFCFGAAASTFKKQP
jgi:hypothetical protein